MAFEDKTQRYFYRIDAKGNPVPGSLIKRKQRPLNGVWREVTRNICCVPPTTTTTTTSSSTTTTTT